LPEEIHHVKRGKDIERWREIIMRQYQSAWNLLKERKILHLAVPAILHKRVITAIIKEKKLDLDYKDQLAMRYKRAKISYVILSPQLIEFKLNVTIGLGDL
jgi:hypothetical protein